MADDAPTKVKTYIKKRGTSKLKRMRQRKVPGAEPMKLGEVVDAVAEDAVTILEPDLKELPDKLVGMEDDEAVLAAKNSWTSNEVRYKPEYARQARFMCKLGATDLDLAEWFGVSIRVIVRWRVVYPNFGKSLTVGKDEFDDRVERTLAMRAVGYTYDAEKIFCNEGDVTRVPYREHALPDVTACIFWLKNRRPDKWRERSGSGNNGSGGVINITITQEEAEL